MSPRTKKFIGVFVLLIGVMVYAFAVLTIGQIRMAEAGPLAQLAFFAFFGLVWIVPAALLIRWMERVDRPR
ncbi:DUF2842 domain-containing protein [Hansschlegelia sp.]|uniref:DUF2842 domain-containing protein n=1 Tax=Hansschlegelia sp. TaxID=2041892 RepID=UPI002CCC1C63|nr:DUF2842 domain-containing protein [Hansschlegelia sp.]HVI29296.1 DUF2842 domain-containing protein [Hansschlegelia sp.]